MNVLDVDTVGSCTVLEDDLLQEHESSLMLCMLPHLQQPGNHNDNDLARMGAIQQRHLVVKDGMTGRQILCACTCASENPQPGATQAARVSI